MMILKQRLFFAVLMLTGAMVMGDLAGYWAFDEGSGMAVTDSSGKGKNGTLHSANKANYPQWTTGHNGTGSALRFNTNTSSSANSNRVVIDPNFLMSDPNLPGLTNIGKVFTVAMWVRRDAVDYFNNLYPNLVHTSAYNVQLALDPSAASSSPDAYDYLGWTGADGNRIAIGTETTAQKTLGAWYHLAVVCDGESIKKYVNGTEIESVSIPGAEMPLATANFVIGSKLDNTSYFTGALDDVAVWADSYLPAGEVAKLANNTATPLTVIDSGGITPVVYSMETAMYPAGWSAVWDEDMNKMMVIKDNHVIFNTNWHFYEPGSQHAIRPTDWYLKDEMTYEDIPEDITRYGVEWIDPSWSGREPDMAVIAAYITPGLIFGQNDWGYHLYNPGGPNSWEDKPYFRTNIRVAAVNSNGASVRITVYTRSSDAIPDPNNCNTLLTFLGEIECPLDAGDRIWQHYEFTLPKPESATRIPLWFEMAIVGGTEDTVLYIDNFKPASSLYATFKAADISKDSFIAESDFDLLSLNWLDSTNTNIVDPRSGGLLTNGDFSNDLAKVLTAGSSQTTNPTGWVFTGTGNYGIRNTSKLGRTGWYYTQTMNNPMGGNVSAFTSDMFAGDPNGVLEQTASAASVAGQTYYAMGHVMTYDYTDNGNADWYGWNDTATMEIVIGDIVKASFSRKLSRSIWRAIYGAYTATAADAGKPIKIRFSYDNSNTTSYSQSGTMYVGNAYLGTTIPNEWPEKRGNLLMNGGFEDLSQIQTALPDLYTKMTQKSADKSGGSWFATGMPTSSLLPGWFYEVASGYNLNNQGGVFCSSYYSAPIPSPGMNDVAVYGSGTMVYGQIVGALTAGTTYYLDTACGVLIEPQTWGSVSVTWPNPLPTLHIELWRIPASITDPATIHTGVTNSLSGYVKIASADITSTGDIKANNDKWQIIGTAYTATAADTNVYVRIYGTNPVTSPAGTPSFVFSDVYLSTEKRVVAGDSLLTNISSGVGANTIGLYDCYQAGLMGYTTPDNSDINGDCTVNIADFALLASQWLEVGIEK